MKSIFLVLFALAVSVSAVRINDLDNPITQYTTSVGRGGLVRVDHLEAEIHSRHLNKRRKNFATTGPLQTRWLAIRKNGDERGHLVGAQFSGPPEWYNLAPQNRRVNFNRGGRQTLTDWANTERAVNTFVNGGADRHVTWVVDMRYPGDAIRPDEFTLNVNFYEKGVLKPYKSLSLNNIDNGGVRFWQNRPGK